uniref:Uncharacterized protein n=1 Tax=Propithecus coquereli TaxID=379532 RepID=A0A2K6EQB8_PROCO
MSRPLFLAWPWRPLCTEGQILQGKGSRRQGTALHRSWSFQAPLRGRHPLSQVPHKKQGTDQSRRGPTSVATKSEISIVDLCSDCWNSSKGPYVLGEISLDGLDPH